MRGHETPQASMFSYVSLEQCVLKDHLLRSLGALVDAILANMSALSDEHFSVDGTMIEAWASHESFVHKDGSGPDKPAGRNPETDFKGKTRSSATHQSTTDPQARLYKKGEFTEAKLRYKAHALSENRNGLVVDLESTQATGRAEWEAAIRMIDHSVRKPGVTVGADKGYDTAEVVAALVRRGIKAHVARKVSGSAVDGRTAESTR